MAVLPGPLLLLVLPLLLLLLRLLPRLLLLPLLLLLLRLLPRLLLLQLLLLLLLLQEDTYCTPFCCRILWQKWRGVDGVVRQTAANEDSHISPFNWSSLSPALRPSGDRSRLESGDTDCFACRELYFLYRQHIDFLLREPAGNLRYFLPEAFRVPADYQEAASDLAIEAIPSVFRSAAAPSPWPPAVAVARAPAVGAHNGGLRVHLLSGPGRETS